MFDFFDILKTLSEINSPTGCEKSIADKIEELAHPFADEIYRDALGNLIVHKKGDGARLMLTAHIDTIGMIATHYDDNGFIRFGALGGLTLSDIHNIPVIFTNGVYGVLSYDTKVGLKDRKLSNFYIDIGAESADEAKKLVPLGTCASFCGEPVRLGKNKIRSPYLDNRAGAALLLMSLATVKSNYDLYYVFTAQEEVGLRGARVAAHSIEPEFAINIDVTDTGDMPESDIKMDVKLGSGCAIKIMDRSIICHQKIISALQKLADKNEIPYQNEIMADGGTDAGEIHLSRGGVICGGISIPTRYIHSPCEVLDMRDIDSAYKLLNAALCENIFF